MASVAPCMMFIFERVFAGRHGLDASIVTGMKALRYLAKMIGGFLDKNCVFNACVHGVNLCGLLLGAHKDVGGGARAVPTEKRRG